MTGPGGFGIIPAGAKILAALVFTGIVAAVFWFLGGHDAAGLGIAMGLGMGMGAVAAALILLAGYIYADASRRDMPPVAWTALALLVPNCIGFVLYFLLRKPIVHPCSRCGNGVAADAAYCPRCGQPQSNCEVQHLCKQ